MAPWLALLLAGAAGAALAGVIVGLRCRIMLRQLAGTQAELERTRRRADEASEAKSRFLGNMGHELRTPLNAINGYAFLLREQALERGADYLVPDLEQIQLAGEHLLDLINDVLDLSRIETGHIELQRTRFDVALLLDAVATSVRPLVVKNGNTLRVEGDDAGAMVSDEKRVRQVLVCLLSNAAKFTEDGTITLAARREADAEGRACVAFRVTDTGVGMSAEQIRRAFDTFWQADQSVTRRHEGAGLGLGLARTLCAVLGGRLEAESATGKGTTCTALLPVEITSRDSGRWREAGRAGPDDAG